jgi:hypothetical protein
MRFVFLLGLAALIVGCNDDSSGASNDAGDGTGDGGTTDTDTDTDTGSETEDEDCAGVTESAQNGLSPVDIIIAVDTSGSMSQEAVFVQESMNSFSEQITSSGINARIILISRGSLDSNGICVDPPLGGGDCPNDSNPPDFIHMPREVASSDGLLVLSSTYGTWKTHLRDNSVRHMVIVSDDNSEAMFWNANWFINTMAKKNPPFDDFYFHAIVSSLEADVACAQDPPHPCCQLSAGRGTVYEKLVTKTEGVLADLCEQDFQPVFDKLAEVMTDVPIACEWKLPPPPKDQVLDPTKVNVEFIDGEGEVHEIGYVESRDDCAGVEHGWYYDDENPPTKIYVCSQTCKWIQADLDAQVAIKFGCNRIEAPPV